MNMGIQLCMICGMIICESEEVRMIHKDEPGGEKGLGEYE